MVGPVPRPSGNDVMHAEMHVIRLQGGPCHSAFKVVGMLNKWVFFLLHEL